MCSIARVRSVSFSTRTPTSIELRQAAFTVARTVTSSPTRTGRWKVMRSKPTVTTRWPQWRMAAMPATSSHSFRITPPWALPAEFDSGRPIHERQLRTRMRWAAGLQGH